MGRTSVQSIYKKTELTESHRARKQEDKNLIMAWQSLTMGLKLFFSQLEHAKLRRYSCVFSS